jgi:hypothetical protein
MLHPADIIGTGSIDLALLLKICKLGVEASHLIYELLIF